METNVRDKMLKLFAKAGIGGDLEVTDVPHGISVLFQSPNPGDVRITVTFCHSRFDVRLEGSALVVSPQTHTQLMDFDVVGILDAVKLATHRK
jgi:hypothetical protein